MSLLSALYRSVLLLALAGMSVVAVAAAPPEWVRQAAADSNLRSSRDADAEFLLKSDEVTYLSADRVRTRRRTVVRILADGGRRHADVSVLYRPECEKILSTRAWIITGKGRMDTFTHHDFVDHVRTYSEYIWDSQRVLSFPASTRVAAGDVLATEIEIESISGLFDCSHDFYSELPVMRHVLEVVPPPGMTLAWHASSREIPEPVHSAGGSLSWNLRDLPPLMGLAPPGYLANPLRVSVRPAATEADSTWASLARQLYPVIGPRLSGDPSVRDKATSLAAAAGTRWDKIRAVAQFVQRDIYYLSITSDRDYLAGYRPHTPGQVLANRYGDCKDKAALVVAMLREIAEPAWIVLVHCENPAALVPEWPSASFNHAIVAFPADSNVPGDWPCADAPGLGRVVLFDPTDPITPLGLLPAVDEGGLGLAIASPTTDVLRLPVAPPDRRTLARSVEATLDERGELRATFREQHDGAASAEAYVPRWAHGDAQFTKDLEQRVRDALPLARDIKWKDHWDEHALGYNMSLEFTAPGFGRLVNGTLMFIGPKILAERDRLPEWTIRGDGVSWLHARRSIETATLAIPAAFTVESLPGAASKETPHLVYSLQYRIEKGRVVFDERIEVKSGFLDKTAYDEFASAMADLIKLERRLITLHRIPVATVSLR